MLFYLVLYLASTGFVANALLVRLENTIQRSPKASHYDAVIVLTGMTGFQHEDNEMTSFSGAVDRILTGIRMVKIGYADVLIISGGDGSLTQHRKAEALILKDFAVQWGLTEKQVLVEHTSRNTYENAVLTAELLKSHRLNRLLLVTSAFHMLRSSGCFNKAGLKVDVYPVDYRGQSEVADFRGFLPSSNSLAKTNLVIHEVVGIIAYWVSGKADYRFSLRRAS